VTADCRTSASRYFASLPSPTVRAFADLAIASEKTAEIA
jgi:hypothetical protein